MVPVLAANRNLLVLNMYTDILWAPVNGYTQCQQMLQEVGFIRRVSAVQCEVDPGFVPNMRVPGRFYVNAELEALLFDELRAFSASGGHGGFLPAVKQLANVAALPGIVQVCRPCSHLLSGFSSTCILQSFGARACMRPSATPAACGRHIVPQLTWQGARLSSGA